jgi:hypothetical protein
MPYTFPVSACELEPEDDADDIREDVTAEKTMHYT